MAISYNSIALECATFRAQGSLTVGEPCVMAGDKTVSACISGGDFLGVVMQVRGSIVTVAIRGFVTVPYTGALPTIGNTVLVSDGNHRVTVGDTGTVRTVVSRDAVSKTVTFLL